MNSFVFIFLNTSCKYILFISNIKKIKDKLF
jgi:hypothetical protein